MRIHIHDSRQHVNQDSMRGLSDHVCLGLLIEQSDNSNKPTEIMFSMPYIGEWQLGEYADVSNLSSRSVEIVIEIASKCRALAAELLRHADRLEGEVLEEVSQL